MSLRCRLPLFLLLMLFSGLGWAGKKINLDYQVRLLPESDQAEVRLTLAQGSAVRSLDFDLGSLGYYSDFLADGQWQPSPGLTPDSRRGTWRPAPGKASLSYRVSLNHTRADGSFETRITPTWALLRGEDLVPPAHLDQQDGTDLVSRLEFELPAGWKSVETAWPRIGKQRFRIDNVSRLFDRPLGWIVAGDLGSRRTRLGETDVTVAAPRGEGMRRMDVLTLLTFVWPKVQEVFPRNPGKLLVVGAGESMVRGGRAGRDSIYLHSNAALISESGESALVRELVHVFGRINDRQRSDWIGEGLAQYYAIELLRRAGGMSEERYQALQVRLTRVSRKVTTLRGEQVSGATVARAVLLLQALDREIRQQTDGKHSLDDVSRAAMRLDTVSTEEFIQLCDSVMGGPSKVLVSNLLK
ncbi:hypothetical protein [Pseudomonas sp. MWU13-2105]|uniref:hypothetical protein n=1 Tax=Pseudomonas sp. MWU13-2105 TaxID=2935074 RepID=UPI00200BF01B|nr:hypothetical protein [Pseudomonas sp. MWU13-2105]